LAGLILGVVAVFIIETAPPPSNAMHG